MDKFFVIFGKIALILIIGGLLVAAGYFLAIKSGFNLPSSNSNNPNISTESTPAMTTSVPTSTPSSKTVSGGLPASSKLSFSAYNIAVPNDWAAADQKDLSIPTDKIILTKGGYSISIFQGATGGADCVYPGSPTPEGPAAVFSSFVEFAGADNITYRRGPVNSANISGQSFGICAKIPGNAGFGQPTPYGHVAYSTPKNPDSSILTEMDSVVATLTKAQ